MKVEVLIKGLEDYYYWDYGLVQNYNKNNN